MLKGNLPGNNIRRFPRLPKGDKKVWGLSKRNRISVKMTRGDLPRGYDHLTKKHRRVAQRYAAGLSVRDICKLERMDSNTFYAWMNYHKLFRQYVERCSQRQIELVDARLDARMPRAVKVIEEALESSDMYHATDAAFGLLKGRGKLKHTVQSKQEIESNINLRGKIKAEVVDKSAAHALVEGLRIIAAGAQQLKPKVIDVKALPESIVEELRSERTPIQADDQGETAKQD